MKEVNGKGRDDRAALDPDLSADYLDGQLRALSEKLEARGLKAKLVTYPLDGVKGDHYDAVVVTNPDALERGTVHVDSDGCVTWECPGSMDVGGITKTADEVTNALWATGVRYRSRESS